MHDKLAFTAGILLESHQLIEAVQLGLQTVRVAFTASILLESHQLTKAVQLGCKSSETSLYRWHSAGISSAHKSYTARLQTIRDK